MANVTQEEAPASEAMRWSWRRNPKCVWLAREQLRKYLVDQGAAELTDRAALLLSEVVTNAVVHAHVSPGREIETVFRLTPEKLRIEVSDASNEFPTLRHADADDEGGRGLQVVATLSNRWRVDPRTFNDDYVIGKTVWFEIDRLS